MTFLSEDRLRQAVCEAGDLLDASLPEPDQCQHTFSPAFEKKMKKVLRRHRRLPIYRGLQRAACLFLACLLGGAVLLSTNAQAREIVFGWVREQVEGAQRYFHQGDIASASEIVHYQIDVPVEYTLSSEESGVAIFHQFYANDTGEYIDFTYQYEAENTSSESFIIDTESERISTSVNGIPADIYMSFDEHASNTIVWTDQKTGALIDVTAFMDIDDLITLAETVTPILK